MDNDLNSALKIAVAEDDEFERKNIIKEIKAYMAENGYEAEIYSYKDGESLIQAHEPGKYSLIFLDILMKGMTGIETARAIRRAGDETPVIFATSTEEYAVESYEVDALYYIIKPVTKEKLDKALNKCAKMLAESSRGIDITVNRETVRVLLRDISYAEVFGNKVLLHTPDGEMGVYMPLEKLMGMLDETFLRCHKSYVVNMNHIARVSGKEFVMDTGVTVPIRSNGKSEVIDSYNRFFIETVRGKR